jgi:hypothetical protein
MGTFCQTEKFTMTKLFSSVMSQFYLLNTRDVFDGDGVYRLNVPANVPVKQYWSVTICHSAMHACYIL